MVLSPDLSRLGSLFRITSKPEPQRNDGCSAGCCQRFLITRDYVELVLSVKIVYQFQCDIWPPAAVGKATKVTHAQAKVHPVVIWHCTDIAAPAHIIIIMLVKVHPHVRNNKILADPSRTNEEPEIGKY